MAIELAEIGPYLGVYDGRSGLVEPEVMVTRWMGNEWKETMQP